MSLRPQGGMNDGACMAAKGEEASMTEREGRGEDSRTRSSTA